MLTPYRLVSTPKTLAYNSGVIKCQTNAGFVVFGCNSSICSCSTNVKHIKSLNADVKAEIGQHQGHVGGRNA